MITFESYDRREKQILSKLAEYGIGSIEEAEKITKDAGLDVYHMIENIQPICFENAKWAYTVGAAIAIKKGCRKAADAAAAIGEGLQAFCIPGSVADRRKVGLGHGNLGKMLLEEDTECFAFLAGHESFAAAEGAIGIASKANKVRQKPLRVILDGLGKDAAQVISRINGFTYVETEYDYATGELKEVFRKCYSKDPENPRAKVNCYGANDVQEGVAILWKENVDVSITGNSTNPTRFQHPVAGTYKKERLEAGKKYFSVASGGGTGRTLHPDNMAAGPASYGMTDTMGRMHSDAQFAGSSSVPAHVEMMGLIGAGNNPMVGMTVSVAVSVEEAATAGKFQNKTEIKLYDHIC
ncbi:MAG: GGGtGRT protein [Mogibacterium sp.]|nr:GGGtGRT protein [Mogibacterium sp.]